VTATVPTSPQHKGPGSRTGAAVDELRVAGLAVAHRSGCAEWDVKGVVSHLVTVDQYCRFALSGVERRTDDVSSSA
jgi:hypothetical protein